MLDQLWLEESQRSNLVAALGLDYDRRFSLTEQFVNSPAANGLPRRPLVCASYIHLYATT